MLDLLGDRRARGHSHGGSVLVEIHVDELHSGGVRVDAHPVHGTHRIGTRETHAQIGIEDDDAVADAGRVFELVVVLAEGEGSLGDHVSKTVEQ